MSSFRLVGLDPAPFAPLFQLDDAQLAARGMARVFADADHGYPCRVSLADARRGEELLLLPWMHQAAQSPYRSSGPVFVRRAACRRVLAPGEVPPYAGDRLVSLRAYDAAHLMVDAEVCAGREAGAWLEAAFGRGEVAYVHLHNARRGCFSCLAERVGARGDPEG
ncbi:DUF1203 domain-containing protein [Pseudoxanthomonas suwonensis]|uniref:DUF1203 domain-containing protein n=1 Tax=Pseudoxanthomonas suwonensis TaxID=314722 RepID=UPI00048CA00D|nr:DUF1203 domain-containing protein [Pseudoxanthomonas suwonensis]